MSAYNVSLKGVMLLAVDAETANHLELSQLVEPGCLADAVYASNISALQVQTQKHPREWCPKLSPLDETFQIQLKSGIRCTACKHRAVSFQCEYGLFEKSVRDYSRF
eukprot:5728384-Pyramimonas_sp.AAC.1